MEKQDLESGKKLVSESGNANSKDIEVKFVPPDPRNGDAKIDIENLKCVFTGMGKEELMKYADDPFWVRLRWFLFILFWAIWIAMLVGAIGIIAYAPKCSSVSKSQWELSPIFKINVRTYANGKLKDVENKLDYIKSLGVSNLVLSSIFKSSSKVDAADYVEDFESVDPAVGTSDDFDALMKAAKDKDLKVQLALVPNHSSTKHPFFQKSIKKEASFADYYVWKMQNGSNKNGDPEPPNNQLNVNGGSAWTWNDERKEFYFHQFAADQPDFNFGHSGVIDYFKNVFALWSAKGVSGFSLEKVQYLINDPAFTSDSLKITGTDLLTLKSPQLVNVLQRWEKSISNHSGVLTVDGLISKSGDTVTLVSRPPALSDVFTAANLHQVVNSYLSSSTWPSWQFSCSKSAKLEECWKPELRNALQMVSILLPGTPIINAGDELSVGIFKPDTELPVSTPVSDSVVPTAVSNGHDQLINADNAQKIFKKLADVRSLPAFAHEISEAKVLKDSVFAFTRVKKGSLSFLVAFNPTENTVSANFSEMKSIPSELTVEAWSRPLAQWTQPLNGKLNSANVTIPPGTALLSSYMPQV